MLGYVRKLPFWRNYTTAQWSGWWARRKIDWKTSYLDNWNHPHRQMISAILKTFPWMSLLEVGCGAGANLAQIVKTHPVGKQLGGIDVNPEAIELAKQTFAGAFLKVGSVEDIMMSDNSADVILSDMCLIYVGPRKIGKVLQEMKRVARSRVVLCELHSDSWVERLKLKYQSGLHAYDYLKLLEKHGFHDVIRYKLPIEAWPEGEKQKKFGYVIVAKIPKRK